LTEIKLDKRYDGEFQFATTYLTQNIYRYAKGGRPGSYSQGRCRGPDRQNSKVTVIVRTPLSDDRTMR